MSCFPRSASPYSFRPRTGPSFATRFSGTNPKVPDSGWLVTRPGGTHAGHGSFAAHSRVNALRARARASGARSAACHASGRAHHQGLCGQTRVLFRGPPLTVRQDSFLAKLDAQIRRTNYHGIIGSHVYSAWKIPKLAPAGTQCEGVLQARARREDHGGEPRGMHQ